MIYDDYISYAKQYADKYGDKSVVFMQVGDFFELYAIHNESERIGADIYKVCDLCNIQVSRKNKSVLENSRQNPLMAGFPISAIQKFIQILIQHQYTIILIRQVTPPPNPKREVTEIISPSTYLNVATQEGSYLMTLYWELHKTLWSIGIALLDITTGVSNVYEAYSIQEDPNFALDETVRMIQNYQPKEILIMGETPYKEASQLVESYRHIVSHQQWGQSFEKLYQQNAYQNAVLEKAFQPKGIVTPIEWIGLERYPTATVAYCAMIQFAYEHNDQLVQKIEIPTLLKNNTRFILESNSVQQLNILASSSQELPLMTILNRCATAFGGRLYRERLLNPIIDLQKLHRYYDQIEYYQQESRYKSIHQQLTNVMDLERILRKIALGTLQPSEWAAIDISLDASRNVFEQLDRYPEMQQLQQLMHSYQSHLNLDECAKYNMVDIHTSLFNPAIYPDLDEIVVRVEKDLANLKDFSTQLSRIGENETTLSRIDYNDRDGYFLCITKKRWDIILKMQTSSIQVDGRTIYVKECKVKPISASSSVLRLTHAAIEEYSDRIISNQRRLSNLNVRYYKDFLSSFDNEWHHPWHQLIHTIADIDVLATNARNSVEYGYTRPTLVTPDSTPASYFKATAMRHPIIERLNNLEPYVSNHVALGYAKKGFLLYGINASGKSSLMKAIGLNIIMAQAGMFVPCESLELAPYHHLFTRIMSSDNIYRGHSTFTVEMLELKNILQRCDNHSIVLGDELCSGTESVSAISIVSAGIHHLLKTESTFVFATHLHELVDISLIKENTASLLIAHMHIAHDEASGKIIYDRTLKEGHGSSLYGLEVCRALKLPLQFLKIANQIRQEFQEQNQYVVTPAVSKYNKEVILSECKVCGKPAKETHHIQQQCTADEHGMIRASSSPPIHKNSKSNLIVLCEECHLKQHHSDEKIIGYKKSIDGIDINYTRPPTSTSLASTASAAPTTLQECLKYTATSGWMVKATKRSKWKKIDHKNYTETRLYIQSLSAPSLSQPLPTHYNEFLEVMTEYQSQFMIC